MGSETALVPLLRASRVSEACRLAERRLRVSGVATLSSFGQDGIDGVRLLASLLVPVEVRSFERYALPMVLKKEEELQTLGGEGIA
jgi:CRISPR-associated protein Csx17